MPTLSFKTTLASQSLVQSPLVARFGATSANHQGRTYIIGGIIGKEILRRPDEICALSTGPDTSLTFFVAPDNLPSRPLLVGMSAISTGESLLLMGGSAVCFAFGSFWNQGCYTLYLDDLINTPPKEAAELCDSKTDSGPRKAWRYSRTVDAVLPARPVNAI